MNEEWLSNAVKNVYLLESMINDLLMYQDKRDLIL